MEQTTLSGYLRNDGRKGIRNIVTVVYLVECARHVATEIASGHEDAHVVGFPGCYPNEYAEKVMARICTHPNVGGVILVSLGCESFNHYALAKAVEQSGRLVKTHIIQKEGGTRSTIELARTDLEVMLGSLANQTKVDMDVSELTIATICGGSDGTSGLTGNPATGVAFDKLVSNGATCIFEETGELIGCENIMSERAATPELATELRLCVEKAARYYSTLGYGSFAPGNADGGLSTIEEKSLGAYAKSGQSVISGIIKPGDLPPKGGLYLLDVVPDGEVRFGFPNIADNAEIVELMACGAHMTIFVTGRGSVVGSAISPVIKVAANPEMYKNMADDMDINAGKILQGEGSVNSVGEEIFALVKGVANGEKTKSEALGHKEFILTYKTFEPIGPNCLPA